MKLKIEIVILPLVMLYSFTLKSADTNVGFLPNDSGLIAGGNDGQKKGPQNAESLPAEMDPTGNWGPITNGLQLSLRLPTNVFVAGEPINASVIFRNTTSNDIVLHKRFIEPIPFVITRDGSFHLTFTNPPGFISGSLGYALRARRQAKYL